MPLSILKKPTQYIRSVYHKLSSAGSDARLPSEPPETGPSQSVNFQTKPDADTAYVTIRRPPNMGALGHRELIAPLHLYALKGPDDALCGETRGSHAAHTLCKMAEYTYERSALLTAWGHRERWSTGGSKTRPWEGEVYEAWEKETYRGLEEMAAKFNEEGGDIGISVVRDDQTREKLERDGCLQVLFSDLKANPEAASNQASTQASKDA